MALENFASRGDVAAGEAGDDAPGRAGGAEEEGALFGCACEPVTMTTTTPEAAVTFFPQLKFSPYWTWVAFCTTGSYYAPISNGEIGIHRD